jgi:hypothetical protein
LLGEEGHDVEERAVADVGAERATRARHNKRRLASVTTAFRTTALPVAAISRR